MMTSYPVITAAAVKRTFIAAAARLQAGDPLNDLEDPSVHKQGWSLGEAGSIWQSEMDFSFCQHILSG